MRKDIAGQLFHVVAFNASGRVSGDAANITCTISIDGGTRVTTSDVNPTEIGTTGVYVFTLSQAETDGHELSFIPSSSTSGVQVLGMPSNVIYTSTVDLTANAISSLALAAGLSAGDFTISLTIKDEDENTIPECSVIITTSSISSSTNVIAYGLTNVNGVIARQLSAGTYYVWRRKAGYSFNNPKTLTVSAAGVSTIT